ncbi:MAG: AI-2E family transporter [Acidimicrobiia bacterium]
MADEHRDYDEPKGRNLTMVIRRLGVFSWSMIGVLILTAIVFWLIDKGRIVLAPLLLAVVIVFVLNPMVSWLHRRGVPRILGALLGFLAFFAGLALVAVVVTPDIIDQTQSLVDRFPTIFDDTAQQLRDLLDDLGFGSIAVWSYQDLVDYLNDPGNRDTLIDLLTANIGSVTAGVFEFILVFLIGPVLAFYFLVDLPSTGERMVGLIPPKKRGEMMHLGRQLNVALGGFLRGQLVVALIVGSLLSFGYWLIGLDFWLLIGIIGGILNIVPFLGPWIGGALGVIVALTTGDFSTVVWAVVVAVVVQQIDNNFVSPTVLRATVRLHPTVTLLVLVLGGALAGIWGVIIAVPLTASLKILVGHWWRTRVLGQTWEEAAEAMFDEPVVPRHRRTGELPVVIAGDASSVDTD